MRRLLAVLLLAPAVGVATEWVPRTDEELSAVLRQTCDAAVEAHKPVLVEFSAPWCGDCQLLSRLKEQEPLKSELDKVASVTVDVGRFDRHAGLLKTFQIAAIAHWIVFKPEDCAKPVTDWTVLASSTLEPASGNGPKTAQHVALWLEAARVKER